MRQPCLCSAEVKRTQRSRLVCAKKREELARVGALEAVEKKTHNTTECNGNNREKKGWADVQRSTGKGDEVSLAVAGCRGRRN